MQRVEEGHVVPSGLGIWRGTIPVAEATGYTTLPLRGYDSIRPVLLLEHFHEQSLSRILSIFVLIFITPVLMYTPSVMFYAGLLFFR